MSATELQQAHEELERAVETADDDVRDSVREVADAFGDYAEGDREADHTLLDEHLNTLRQAEERADGETAEHIDTALERAEEYRENLDRA
ncbi:hypothetical protein ACFQGT_13900 [Natrialbaceae archaeon GCM10025810]|uniref:DUF7553 family protein n=1 Tax=Halovalidus salilacus TaxID=3075124 RepID=UPI0036154308